MRHWIIGAAFFFATASTAQAADWRITTGGYGPARIGMSVAEAAQALGMKLEPLGVVDEPACYYVKPQPEISGLLFMVSDDRIVRIDVDAAETGAANGSAELLTRSGLGVGTAEAEVIERLGADAVEVGPHKYTGPEGHYLTVWSDDRQRAVRFETDGAKVTRFYAGQVPQVTYVEGCS